MESELMRFPAGDAIPNHPELAVVAYRGVGGVVCDAAACEDLFAAHGWGGSWRDGVFGFDHFHSSSHEVLGVVRGEATLALGGRQGQEVRVVAGDALVLPAGTGHRRVTASHGFLIVGAYPAGQEDYDIRRGDPAELEEARAAIARVGLPEADPVGGTAGPLVAAWGLGGA